MTIDGHTRKPKRVILYFNQEDEMVTEEEAKKDSNNYYHKYHSVEVEIGGEEGLSYHITKDIFRGKEKAENAMIFVESYQRNKQRSHKMDKEEFESMSQDTDDTRMNAVKSSQNSSIIMDLNPRNFEKPKDNLFFDFFSMYTKKIVEERE